MISAVVVIAAVIVLALLILLRRYRQTIDDLRKNKIQIEQRLRHLETDRERVVAKHTRTKNAARELNDRYIELKRKYEAHARCGKKLSFKNYREGEIALRRVARENRESFEIYEVYDCKICPPDADGNRLIHFGHKDPSKSRNGAKPNEKLPKPGPALTHRMEIPSALVDEIRETG